MFMDDQNPYQAGAVIPTAISPPHWEQVPSRITAPITQLALMGLSLALFAFGLGGWRLISSGSLFFAIDAVGAGVGGCIYLSLAFGVYRRSRVVVCLAGAIWVTVVTGRLLRDDPGFVDRPFQTAVILVVGVLIVRATIATFRYHRHLATQKRQPPRARISDDPIFAPRPPAA
jgi:hypothetical protein